MDEELARYPGLYPRDGIWYVRKRVPSDLRHIERRFQVRLSLETGDRRTAIERYPLKLAEITVGFDKLRAELRERGDMEAALAVGKLEDLGRAEIEQLVAKWWHRREPCRLPELSVDDDPGEAISAYETEAARAGEDAPGLADRLLVEAGMAAYPHKVGRIRSAALYPAVDRSTVAYRHLVDLVARALRIEAKLAKDHVSGIVEAPFDPLFNPSGVRHPGNGVQPDARTTRDLILAYRSERETLIGKESTDRKYGLLFRVLEEVWGAEMPVRSISRGKCIDVLTFLHRLPPNAAKRFPELTLSQAAAHAEAAGQRGLAPQTVASYMQGLGAVLRWGEREGWLGSIHLDRLVPKREALVKRRGFRPQELEVLFENLSAFRDSDATKFWVPALALYTGARLGEICQLAAEDVIQEEGTWCLDLSEFDQKGRRVLDRSLKTEASERLVPLHRHLLEAGFLDFVRAKGASRLFPDLKPGPKGNYSHDFSKWFGRYKKKVGFDIPALVFHSFRHGFRDACRRLDGILNETIDALGGWATGNQGARYGNRGAVPVLDRAIQRIAFGDFRLPAGTVGMDGGSRRIRDNLQPVATAAE